MKKQNGFISSSSSVSICYTSFTGNTSFAGYTGHYNVTSNWSVNSTSAPYTIYSNLNNVYNQNDSYSWKTYASTSYMRIEYFLEAVEKIGEAYHKNGRTLMSLANYSRNVASDELYDGFIDVVITFPTYVRLAGIELINPWVNKLNSNESNNWRYLPSKFNIYKVNTHQINDALNEVTYENDVAQVTNYANEKTIHPIRYDMTENDPNLIFLGNYEVNWESKYSHKCFFRFNSTDTASINLKNNENSTGTATWECKQLVLRIFETKKSVSSKYTKSNNGSYTYIEERIREYILSKELEYGTKYCGLDPSINDVGQLIGIENINNNYNKLLNWKFGSAKTRSYKNVEDIFFASGIDYKLGGIQVLLAPDIFSISEMKMYNYFGDNNSKVYIGEWNPEIQSIEYYGAKTTKISPLIDIGDSKMGNIMWKHNFNIPPKYLDAKMYVRFNIDYDSFKVGDVVSNLVNIKQNPISMKITGSTIEVNLTNGIGFTNPSTGEFISFLDGIGIQMDHTGNNDALTSAKAFNANIVDGGSSVASKTEFLNNEGGSCCPFQVYFVIKRMF